MKKIITMILLAVAINAKCQDTTIVYTYKYDTPLYNNDTVYGLIEFVKEGVLITSEGYIVRDVCTGCIMAYPNNIDNYLIVGIYTNRGMLDKTKYYRFIPKSEFQ